MLFVAVWLQVYVRSSRQRNPISAGSPVSHPDVVELPTNDAGEGWSQETSRDGVLRQAGTEELQVLRGVVESLVGGHRPVTHQADQLLPPGDWLQSTELTEPEQRSQR